MSIQALVLHKQIGIKLSKTYKSSEANEARLKDYIDGKLAKGRNNTNKGR